MIPFNYCCKIGFKVWDHAAGVICVTEAGGNVRLYHFICFDFRFLGS